MTYGAVPILLFVVVSTALAGLLVLAGTLIGPKRGGRVKEMPYESGVDPIHDTRRRFDIRFHLVAIAFLIFDVELLFLYPWAVANRAQAAESQIPTGIDAAVAQGMVDSRGIVFGTVMLFIVLLGAGFIYVWRKGVLRWR